MSSLQLQPFSSLTHSKPVGKLLIKESGALVSTLIFLLINNLCILM